MRQLRRSRAFLLSLVGFGIAWACSAPTFDFKGSVPEEPDASDSTDGSCPNGSCGPGVCQTGFEDCDLDSANGCEVDVRSSSEHCGQCGASCSGRACSGGVCSDLGCALGYADCDGDMANGCEASLDDVASCGMCEVACSDVNGAPSCVNRSCGIDCSEGFDDCDQNPATGCEADVRADSANCGACDAACENANGSTRCMDGLCMPMCAVGFGDCDGDPANGCELDVRSSLTNCGACGTPCQLASASEICDQGVCEIVTCNSGFDDCNGSPADGCEADLSDPQTCGSCDNACSANGGVAICNPGGTCGITCNAGQDDCINGLGDGCETNINGSVLHCGGCGIPCPNGGGVANCVEGVCGISDCTPPLADCNGDTETPGGDGCETNTNTNASHCSGCFIECYYEHGTGVCIAGDCILDECAAGWDDCDLDPTTGCETDLSTITDCRACGNACTNEHGEPACGPSGCEPICDLGYDDCDPNPDNGCETPLNTLSNCGDCGIPCSKPHAVESCGTGLCEIVSCDSGWDDCQNEVMGPGCETNIQTLANCGGCGVGCDMPHIGESCATGTCVQQGVCDLNWADCSGVNDGCETPLRTPTDCLDCGDACSNPHGTFECLASGCTPDCQDNYASCDGDLNNGCERQIWTLTDCLTCDSPCAFPNAAATCPEGVCTMGSCDMGFANCSAEPGCETAGTGCGSGGAGGGGGAGGTGGGGGAGGGPSGCGTGTVFCDDFEDGNETGWTQSSASAWNVVTDGSYVYTTGPTANGQEAFAGAGWANLRVEAWVKIATMGGTADTYGAGIVARASGTNFIVFRINGAGALVVQRNTSNITGCNAMAEGLIDNTWYLLRMDVSGVPATTTIKTYLNGALKHNCVASLSVTYTSGQAGVMTRSGSTVARFDDVKVWSPIPP